MKINRWRCSEKQRNKLVCEVTGDTIEVGDVYLHVAIEGTDGLCFISMVDESEIEDAVAEFIAKQK